MTRSYLSQGGVSSWLVVEVPPGVSVFDVYLVEPSPYSPVSVRL
ncbi:hypothetical protein [Actinomadura alba]|nr:hypothetical protein [Actinomadura alba]